MSDTEHGIPAPIPCPDGHHRRVRHAAPARVDHVENAKRLRQDGVCLDCGFAVFRVTEIVHFNPWQTIPGRAQAIPRRRHSA